MLFRNFYAAGALGLYISVLPVAAYAQSSVASAEVAGTEESAIFVPIVGDCVDTPNPMNCGQVRAVVTECAADLDNALCDVLFEDSNEIFEKPALKERAQVLLSQTSAAIAEMEFKDAHQGEIGDIVEASRADAERTMLRGDANLNSHSGPPLFDSPDGDVVQP